jgi:hypothetical protein
MSLIDGPAHGVRNSGNALAACAVMLSRPDPREGLTLAPLKPPVKIIYDKGETSETLASKDAKELEANEGERTRRR